MATTAFFASSARAVSAPENWAKRSGWSVMANSYPLKIGTKLGDAAASNYQPDGRG
jgi:hypothetical protein